MTASSRFGKLLRKKQQKIRVCHCELSRARALSVAAETTGFFRHVIPPKKAMHGWTSQPWHPTVVFMDKGVRRDMNIPPKRGQKVGRFHCEKRQRRSNLCPKRQRLLHGVRIDKLAIRQTFSYAKRAIRQMPIPPTDFLSAQNLGANLAKKLGENRR